MAMVRLPRFSPENPEVTYVSHQYPEGVFDTGEMLLNYACAGTADKPALLLVPGQTESWWGYEQAMTRLEADFHVFAVDLRGQGRSSRAPGRYTFDNMGNDLVRFIAFEIRRPTVVAGLSSGGVLAAWLSAYAPPGLVRGACYEDPPLFTCELTPACGPFLRQNIGGYFALLHAHLGNQWSVGDWAGVLTAGVHLPFVGARVRAWAESPDEPPQNLKEYDPEWAQAFVNGTVSAGCDHATMLAHVRCPALLTHHSWSVDETTGNLAGAMTDQQAARVLTEWANQLPAGTARGRGGAARGRDHRDRERGGRGQPGAGRATARRLPPIRRPAAGCRGASFSPAPGQRLPQNPRARRAGAQTDS